MPAGMGEERVRGVSVGRGVAPARPQVRDSVTARLTVPGSAACRSIACARGEDRPGALRKVERTAGVGASSAEGVPGAVSGTVRGWVRALGMIAGRWRVRIVVVDRFAGKGAVLRGVGMTIAGRVMRRARATDGDEVIAGSCVTDRVAAVAGRTGFVLAVR